MKCTTKKAVLKNFLRKQLCWSLFFNKNAGLETCNFIKKTLQHRCFLDSNCEILKNSYFEEHLWTATSESFSFYVSLLTACNFIKKETLALVFSCEFCEISGNTFLQNTSGRLLPNIVFMIKLNLVTTLKQFTQPQVDLFQDNKTLGKVWAFFHG